MGHGDQCITAVAQQVNDLSVLFADRKYVFGNFMGFNGSKGKLFLELIQFSFTRCCDGVESIQFFQFSEFLQAFIVNIDIIPGVYAKNIQEDVPQKGIS